VSPNGPILILEDDPDDQLMYTEAINELDFKNKLYFYEDGNKLIDYLLTTSEQPFLIISDVNLPIMRGPELKKRIMENDYLRLKSIPFIFLSTTANVREVREAYELMVQGYFVKENTFEKIKETLNMIVSYWKICKHPNNME
jgi:CheY-like chemotaxis protein